MNIITLSDNIFSDASVTIDYLTSNRALQGNAIDTVGLIQLKISGDDNDDQFNEFMDSFIDRLKWSYDLYFLYSQNHGAKKSRARSYAKLFYQLRKQYDFNPSDIKDKEVDLDTGYSNMVGIIKANDIDNQILIDDLMKNSFRYGLAVQKIGNHCDTEEYLELFNKDLFDEDKALSINSVKLIESYVKPSSFLYTYRFDGNDDLVFTVYAGKEIFEEVENLLSETVGKLGPFEKRMADAKEMDEIVEMYLQYPKVHKSK